MGEYASGFRYQRTHGDALPTFVEQHQLECIAKKRFESVSIE
jgi:hypothetical protein